MHLRIQECMCICFSRCCQSTGCGRTTVGGGGFSATGHSHCQGYICGGLHTERPRREGGPVGRIAMRAFVRWTLPLMTVSVQRGAAEVYRRGG